MICLVMVFCLWMETNGVSNGNLLAMNSLRKFWEISVLLFFQAIVAKLVSRVSQVAEINKTMNLQVLQNRIIGHLKELYT